MPEETKPVEREAFEKWLTNSYGMSNASIALWAAWQASANNALERAADAVEKWAKACDSQQQWMAANHAMAARDAILALKGSR